MDASPATPIKTNFSANFNHHAMVREGGGVLILQPVRDRTMLWTGVHILALSPVIYFAVHHFLNDRQLLLWGTLMPLLAGGPLILFSLASGAVGTKARFDRDRGELVLTGMRFGQGVRYGLGEIREVQLCSAGMRGGGKGGAWESFQLNLRLEQSGEVVRINLLENADERDLRDLGCSLSEFLGIPFNDAAKLNLVFRQTAHKVGGWQGRRVVSIFLFVLAAFCLIVACVLASSDDVPRWAPLAVGGLGVGILIFTGVWAYSRRLSSFHCPVCGGPVKIVRGASTASLLVCEKCGQSAPTGVMG